MRTVLFCSCLLILFSSLRVGAVEEPGTFSHVIEVTGDRTRTLTFGMDPSAGDEHDTTFDLALPPPSPNVSEIGFVVNSAVSRLSTDIKKTNTEGSYWSLSIDIMPGGYFVLNWGSEFASFLDERALTLRNTAGSFFVDMKSVSSITITSGGLYYLAVGTGGNQAPTPVADSATMPGDEESPVTITIPVLSNDSDPDGDSLSVFSVVSPTPGGGSAEVTQDGTGVRYTPQAGWYGTDTFEYTVADDQMLWLTATASVSVRVDQHVSAKRTHSLLVSPGDNMAVTVTVTHDGELATLAIVEQLPAILGVASNGYWQYKTGSCTLLPSVVPTQSDGLLTIDLGSSVPASPFSFSYDVEIPLPESSAQIIDGELSYRLEPDGTVLSASMEETVVGVVTPGDPSISVTGGEVTEGDSGTSELVFNIALSKVSSSMVTVDYATTDGTATVTSGDYDADTGTLTFTPPEMSHEVRISVNGDTDVEEDESVLLDLSNPGNATIAVSQAAGWIRNDDNPLPEVTLVNASRMEGDLGQNKLWFTVSLTRSPESVVTIDYATVDGSATVADGDYLAASGTLTFSVGQTAATFSVTVYGDTAVESDETFSVVFSNEQNATLVDTEVTGTIKNDDLPTVSVNDVSVMEGDADQTSMVFAVTLSDAVADEVTVDFATGDGTAIASEGDYVSTSGSLTFSANETSKTITVSINGDTDVEEDETLFVTLSNAVNATIGTGTGTGTIQNDDSAGSGVPEWNPPAGVQYSMTVHAVVRLGDESLLSAPGSLLAAFRGDVCLGVSTIFERSERWQFLLAIGNNNVMEDGLTMKVYDASADQVFDINETVNFFINETIGSVASPVEYTASGGGQITTPEISISSVSLAEGDSGQTAFEFAVTLSEASSKEITVDFATGDGTAVASEGDYVPTSGSLTFSANETSKTITISINGDTDVEDDETLFVTLSNAVNATVGTATGTGTIENDDSAGSGVPEWNPPAGVQYSMTVHAMVRLGDNNILDAPGSLLAAFNDGVCLGVTGIYGGDAGPQFELLLGSDTEVKSNVNLRVYDTRTGEIYEIAGTIDFLQNTTMGTSSAPITVSTSSGSAELPSLSIDSVSLSETSSGTTSADFTVFLSRETVWTVVVQYATADGTALAGQDYTAVSGQVTFEPGDTEETLSVLINGDTDTESDETFTMVLSNPNHAMLAVASGTATIRNDDVDVITITVSDASCREPHSGESVLSFTAQLNAAGSEEVRFDYATAAGTATVGDGDYEVSSGSVIFSPGETVRTVHVVVNSDTTDEEGKESMYLNLSNPVNAELTSVQAVGTIEDFVQDASLPPHEQDASEWEPKPGVQYSMTLHVLVQYPDGSALSAPGSLLCSVVDGEIRGVAEIYDGNAGWQFLLSMGSDVPIGEEHGFMVYDAARDFAMGITQTVDFEINTTLGTLQSPEILTIESEPYVSVGDITVMEGSTARTSIQFVITLSWASESSITVSFSSADGTASGDAGDYTPFSGSVTFAPGETEKTVTLTVNDDDETEGDEDFFIVLLEADGGILADPVARATVTDDETTSLPTIAISGGSADEGGAVTFTVTLSEASAGTVTVDYTTADGTAASSSGDYLAASGEIEFAPGETEKTIDIVCYNDLSTESDEIFTVTLSQPVNAVLEAVSSATGTIRDVVPPSINIGNAWASEGDNLVFTVELSHSVSSTVSVNYATEDGSATSSGGDYAAASDTVDFSPGETQKTISVTTYGDTLTEDAETVSLVLSDPVNAVLATSQATGTIYNRVLPKISIEGGSGKEYSSRPYTVLVRISGSYSSTVTVDYELQDDTATVADNDYVAASGTLEFTTDNEDKELHISIEIVDDRKIEEDETIRVVLSNPNGAVITTSEALFKIVNDDEPPPTITIDDAQTVEGGTLEFVVRLNESKMAATTISYSTADGTALASNGDYEETSGTVTVLANHTEATISVPTSSDILLEDDETIFLNLTSTDFGTFTDDQAVGTIINAVPPDIGIGDAEFAEGGNGSTVFEFLVVLSSPSTDVVTVDYETADGTATVADGDYVAASGSVSFAPGELVQSIFITVNGDTFSESDECFYVHLSNADGGFITDSEGAGIIRDDEARWYPVFDLGVEGIVNVEIRSAAGVLVLESQVVDAEFDEANLFEPRDYQSGTGPGRSGLLPGVYYATVAVWNQEFQEFQATGSILPIPEVAYTIPDVPDESSMSSSQLGESNRNWALDFTGATQAQGMVIQVREETSGTIAQEIVTEFLPEEAGDVFPTGPTDAELAQVHLSTGVFQWRLRFFTPLDSPDVVDVAENWSDWVDITTLTADVIDSARKPVIPGEADRWYYPESGSVFSANEETGKAAIDFEWSSVLNADRYYIHISTAEGKVAVNCKLVSSPQLHDVALSPGSYYWALRPANSELGTKGIADSWMSPFPSFTILPSEDHSDTIPGQVIVTDAVREIDGYIRLSLEWTGRVASGLRILVLDPGFMIESTEDRDSSSYTFTTDRLDAYLNPGQTTLIKVQGISDSGEAGPWSAFVQITIPAVL